MKDKKLPSGYIEVQPSDMSSSDEICGLGCWGKKILGRAGKWILGAGRLKPGKLGGRATVTITADPLDEAMLEILKSGRNISMHKSKTHELLFHGMQTENDKQIRWSIKEIAKRSK